jgi:hypothetical protein
MKSPAVFRWAQHALLLAAAGCLTAPSCIGAPPPAPDAPWEEWDRALKATINDTLATAGKSCGFVALGQDRTEATRCMKQAQRDVVAFWVASQVQGIDSQVWIVVRADANANWSEISFDTYDWARRGVVQITERSCRGPKFGTTTQVDGHTLVEPAVHCE